MEFDRGIIAGKISFKIKNLKRASVGGIKKKILKTPEQSLLKFTLFSDTKERFIFRPRGFLYEEKKEEFIRFKSVNILILSCVYYKGFITTTIPSLL